MFHDDALDVGARPRAVAPQREQINHLRNRKAEISGPPDEAERMDVVFGIDPVSLF